jgi:hypothetical protein
MPKFMDVHNHMDGITPEALHAEHVKDLEGQKLEPGVRFLKAWADPKAGKVFCLSEGPSKDAVQRVHDHSGHPADEIYEVSIEEE